MGQKMLFEKKNLTLFINDVDYSNETNVFLDSDVVLIISNPDNSEEKIIYRIKYSHDFKNDKKFKVDGNKGVLYMLPPYMKKEIIKAYPLYEKKENEHVELRRKLKI